MSSCSNATIMKQSRNDMNNFFMMPQQFARSLFTFLTNYLHRYLSPASDDFMGLTLDQYRDVLDSACSEKEPRINCFDDLYKLIFKTVEKVRFLILLKCDIEYPSVVLSLCTLCAISVQFCEEIWLVNYSSFDTPHSTGHFSQLLTLFSTFLAHISLYLGCDYPLLLSFFFMFSFHF